MALIDCYAIILTTLAARWAPLLESSLPRLESTRRTSPIPSKVLWWVPASGFPGEGWFNIHEVIVWSVTSFGYSPVFFPVFFVFVLFGCPSWIFYFATFQIGCNQPQWKPCCSCFYSIPGENQSHCISSASVLRTNARKMFFPSSLAAPSNQRFHSQFIKCQ